MLLLAGTAANEEDLNNRQGRCDTKLLSGSPPSFVRIHTTFHLFLLLAQLGCFALADRGPFSKKNMVRGWCGGEFAVLILKQKWRLREYSRVNRTEFHLFLLIRKVRCSACVFFFFSHCDVLRNLVAARQRFWESVSLRENGRYIRRSLEPLGGLLHGIGEREARMERGQDGEGVRKSDGAGSPHKKSYKTFVFCFSPLQAPII